MICPRLARHPAAFPQLAGKRKRRSASDRVAAHTANEKRSRLSAAPFIKIREPNQAFLVRQLSA